MIMKLLICFFITVSAYCYDYTLGVCAIFKNEARFLKEWIEFHRLVGVEKFYLYNNNSNDNYLEVLEPYIESGIVSLMEWPFQTTEHSYADFAFKVKCSAYNDCLSVARRRCEWMAFIDTDDFIVPIRCASMKKLLKKYYADEVGIVVNCDTFGTSFIEEISSDQLLVERLVMRLSREHWRSYVYKSIVKPACVESFTNPNFCNFLPGYHAVSTDKFPQESNIGCTLHVLLNMVRINNYWTRDERHLREQRIPRYVDWMVSQESIIRDASFMNAVCDFAIQRFVPKLKERLSLR